LEVWKQRRSGGLGAPPLYLSLNLNLDLDLGPSVSYCNLRTGNWYLAPAARDVPKLSDIGCLSRNSSYQLYILFCIA